MKKLQIWISKVDSYQRRHRFTAFSFAVVKKYGDDNAGQQAALLTYYAFLSLFPLLLLLTTLTDRIIGNHPELAERLIEGINIYFPLLGNQLSQHVNGLSSSGFALIAGILFLIYGTRGVADAFRSGVQNMWRIRKSEREGFPKAQLRSLSIVLVGGLGFLLAAVSAGVAAAAGQGLLFRGLSVAINLFILYWLFIFLLNSCLPRRVSGKETRLGAATAAIGLVVLQFVGGYVLAQELRNLDALYSYFAVALGLLFWVYLQAQVLYYAVEISIVSSQKLWPRAIDTNSPTKADKLLADRR